MNVRDNTKTVFGIAAGIAFIIGIGIGLNLYSFTSENNKQEQTDLQPPRNNIRVRTIDEVDLANQEKLGEIS